VLSDKNIPLSTAVSSLWGQTTGMGQPAQEEDPVERRKKIMAAVGGAPAQYGDRTISDAVLSLFQK
jgi:hypothetical protein